MTTNKLKWIFGFSLAIFLLIGLLTLLTQHNKVNALETTENSPQGEILRNNGDIVLDYFMEKLKECESGGKSTAINYHDGKIGVHSYGLYQWQIDSFWRYNLKYNLLPDIEKNEIVNVIYDPELQHEMTRLVLMEKNGWRNWFNCSKSIGLHKFVY